MKTREHYHHGDLRAALVAEGLRQLESDGVASISLRAVSKATGVSPNAPYRHFADKNALMAALAAEGFTRFADGIVAAQGSVPDPVQALRNQGRAYVAFATEHPALYRLMFSPYGYSLTSGTCQREAGRAFGSLIGCGAAAQAVGWKPGHDLPALVLAYWAALHGWAGILGDNLAPPEVPQPSMDAWLDVFFL